MLNQHNTMPTVAVASLASARDFYEYVLGFEPVDSAPGGIVYGSGSTKFLVYESSFAGTNKATYLGFDVADEDSFDEEIEALRSKGIAFDTFEIPDGEWDDGVLSGMGAKSVWFRDPDGNILNVMVRVEG